MDIVVVGSIAFDDVVTEKKAVRNALGGSAMFFAAAASLFAPVYMVGVVGDDFRIPAIGQKALGSLAKPLVGIGQFHDERRAWAEGLRRELA